MLFYMHNYLPFTGKFAFKHETFNEFCVLLSSLIMISYLMAFKTPEHKAFLGWIQIALTITYFIVNLLILFVTLFAAGLAWCNKKFRKAKKNSESTF